MRRLAKEFIAFHSVAFRMVIARTVNTKIATIQDCEGVPHCENLTLSYAILKLLRSHEIFSVLQNVKFLHLG